ncbi:hypothetical protein [Cryptosporangium phraense]|uniref:Uncharacterized protein n=1 Tax=Cryptosporangium phraense TaxID=2593070 RepID=A0A545AJQ6_9ACTN|nr:hypothetical protein [Cryptosporangium phraense]TQS41548.1 hypothetical protein FL583_29130 [Cryptosporangium phraense]
MLALRQVATEPRLFAVSVGGSALVVLIVGWIAGFAVALVLLAGLLVIALLTVVRMIVQSEGTAAERIGAVGDGQARTGADLQELARRVRAVESAQREVTDLRDHVDRLETVVSVLTRWPRDLVDAPVTTSAFYRPAGGDDSGPPTSTRDELDRYERRRAAQERGRKRVARWRTQLKSSPDRLVVYVDVFWLPGAATADGLPMLLLRRAVMEAPAWPPAGGATGRSLSGQYVAAIEKRFAEAHSWRDITFWSAPAGEDLSRLVARLLADRDRWQDLADGLPAAVRDGDAARLSRASLEEIEALAAEPGKAGTEPVRIVRYTALIEGVRAGEPAMRHAYLVWTAADPVASVVADAFDRVLEGMSGETGGAPDLGPGAATADLVRWHGVDGLRVDARATLERRRARLAEKEAAAVAERKAAARHRHAAQYRAR